ncbi:SulP family inorganic anion transporter [Synoicihabitans lomoniglobus]|uniref:SulP family inorganic anion transporter n=1 Tax=Synoicihabitans lomoniglobus TaxID=2909285 RepID=A0AAE9ZUU5_9BACT|nr:SulP family inorganic anion transporter [Opitutaceae bacterium LMO-M01]WED64512.1 SulP family inorganic anion transporter [Opitutaceae bacterium LMO-M01]
MSEPTDQPVSVPPSAPARHRRWGRILRYWARGIWHGIDLDWFPGRRLFRRPPKSTFAADARAGINVALLAFPQSIAFSLIAGVPALMGLISSAVGATVGPFFSGTRFVVLGPTNATAILLLTGLAASGLPAEQRMLALPLFVLMVGFFLVVGALARASMLINYISRSVITGYITAAAALIFVNQFQNILGFRTTGGSTFLGILQETIRLLPQTHWPELVMAAATLALSQALSRWAPKIPSIVATLVLTGLVGLGFKYIDWHIAYLETFRLTNFRFFPGIFDFQLVGNLAAPALALAFVSILEGSSIGKTVASRAGHRFVVNQEMYAMGMANLATAACGGMNASGSLTRSVLNDMSGARSPLANVISGLVVLVLLFCVGPLIKFIPKAALAVLVMGIACSLINRRNLLLALRTTRSDTIVFVVTFVSSLLFTIDAAIYLGAFTSIMLFLKKAGNPELVEYNFNPEGQLAELPTPNRRNVPGISILHAEGDLFFGSTEIFTQQIREVIRDPSIKVVILRLKNARNLDATAAIAIEEFHDFLKKSKRQLLISGAGREITRVLRNSGFIDRLGEENFFREVPANPTLSTRDALKRATQVLGRRDAEIRIFVDQARKKKESDD